MADVKSSKLPIVSIAPFLDESLDLTKVYEVAESLNQACTNHGFFYLVDHGIPNEILDDVVRLARLFFLETPAADKEELRRRSVSDGGDGARGYQILGENVTQGRRDWHEGFDWYSEEFAEGRTLNRLPDGLLSGQNQWPKHPPEFETVYKDYIKRLKRVGTKLVLAMEVALQLTLKGERYEFVSKTDKSFWVMRAIGYPPLPATEDPHDASTSNGISCGEHTDYGCVTFLLADGTKGALQVLSKSGDWINADPIAGAFVVNIGDMMERWTNGLWKSTLHRVIHTSDTYRVSVPFFFEPNFDADIRPLPTCVDRTGGKEKYEAVRYGEHLVRKIRGNFYEASPNGI